MIRSLLSIVTVALVMAPALAAGPRPITQFQSLNGVISIPGTTDKLGPGNGGVGGLSGLVKGNGTNAPAAATADDIAATLAGGGSASNLIDLQTSPPSNGMFLHPNGTFLQMCSQAGCPTGPHMFAQTYGQATTRVDGTAQEIGAFFNFKNKTGYAPNWHAAFNFTNYANSASLAAGALVSSGNILFQTRAACTTAPSGSGPSTWQTPGYGAAEPTANNVPDGSCTFDYVGPSTYNAYTGVGSSQPGSVTAVSNAGNIYTNGVASCTPASSGAGPYFTPYVANASYATGAMVSANGNLYTATVGGTTSGGAGPTNTSGTSSDGSVTWSFFQSGTAVNDGSCKWSYLSQGVNDGKTAFAWGCEHGPGGGNGWCLDMTAIVKPGYGSNVWYGEEFDTNNLNMASYAGAPFFALAHFDGGGSGYTYPIFAYYYLGSGAVNSKDNTGALSRNPYGAYNGFFVSGQGSGSIFGSTTDGSYNVTVSSAPLSNLKAGVQWVGPGFPNGTTVTAVSGNTVTLAARSQGSFPNAAFTYGDYGSVTKDAAFADADNASVGFQLLADRQHAAGFEDDSNSTTSLKVLGTHGIGVDLTGGKYGSTLALPTGGFISFTGLNGASLAHYLGFNGSTGKLQYGNTTGSPTFVLDDAGNAAITGVFSAPLATPASSSAACTAGQFQDDANYHYVCVATNIWKRAALSAF